MKESRWPLRRGVAPAILLAQVKNTAPFLFESDDPAPAQSYIRRLREYKGEDIDHAAYFELALCAHWATAGTYVPTDVDNAIRDKLWRMDKPPETLERMGRLTLEAGRWDYAPVTARLAKTATGERLSTHEGTWFSVAVGAYAALRGPCPSLAREILEAILVEAEREVSLLKTLHAEADGLEILRACALLAHNFGDLKRVADMWELPESDPLRNLNGGWLAYAGRLNQRLMAPENHRHYALRAARGLRRKSAYLLPVGPFFDGWGELLGKDEALPPEDLAEAVRTLIDGWQRLGGPVGYARALAGILEAFPGGLQRLSGFIPSRDARTLKAGPLRALCSLPRPRFEAQWAQHWKKDSPPSS